MNNIDIFYEVYSFIENAKSSLIIYSKDFDTRLYFNPKIYNCIQTLLFKSVSVEIYYEKPDVTEKALQGIKTKYNNFSFAKTITTPNPVQLPDFIIMDKNKLLIFNGNSVKIEPADGLENRISNILNVLGDLKK